MDARTRNLEAPLTCFNCLVNNSWLSTPKITFIGYMIWGQWWPHLMTYQPFPCHQHFLVLEFGFYSKSREFRLQEFVSTRWVFYVFIYIENYEELQTQKQREYFTWCNYPHHITGKAKKKVQKSLEVLLHFAVLRHGWDWELTTNLGTLHTPPIKCFKCVCVSFLITQ